MTAPSQLTQLGQLVTQTQKNFAHNATGAVSRALQDKLRDRVSVKDFGATGNGVTDDSAAVQAAVNYVESLGGGHVYLPAGTYLFSANGISVQHDTIISGDVSYGTIINWNGTGPAFYYHPTGAFNPGFHAIENLSISGGSNSASQGIEISDTFGFRLENISISGFANGEGLILRNTNWWTEGTVLQNVRLGNNLRSLVFRRDSANTWPSFGYTRAMNCAINANAGQTGIFFGDNSTNPGSHVLYNGILDINVWLSGSGVWINFGTNAVIRDCIGTLGGECDNTYSGTGWPPNTATSGLFSPEIFVRSSIVSAAENQYSMTGGTRYWRHRDLGSQRAGLGTTPQWYRIAVVNPTQGLFTGQVKVQGQYGQASFKSATATFSFGVAGNSTGGFLPEMHIVGDAFNGVPADNWSARFVLAYDGTNYILFFRRPSYANVCLFSYTFDWTTGLTYDLFTPDTDPTANGALTVEYDSFNNAAQGIYAGDEQVFTGQRQIVLTNGSTTSYSFAHNLGVIPQWYMAYAMNAVATAAGIKSITADATNINITMNTATAAGTGNVQFGIEFARKAYLKNQRV
jgi:hypothetical protein